MKVNRDVHSQEKRHRNIKTTLRNVDGARPVCSTNRYRNEIVR